MNRSYGYLVRALNKFASLTARCGSKVFRARSRQKSGIDRVNARKTIRRRRAGGWDPQ